MIEPLASGRSATPSRSFVCVANGLTNGVTAQRRARRQMLDMCRELGFEIAVDPDDASIRKVRLRFPAGIMDAALLEAERAL